MDVPFLSGMASGKLILSCESFGVDVQGQLARTPTPAPLKIPF